MNPYTVLILLVVAMLCAWITLNAKGKGKPAGKPPFVPKSKRQSFSMWLNEAFHFGHKGECFANVGESTSPYGRATKKTDAALTSRYLLVKSGTDVDHIAVCAAANQPLGVCIDEASAAEEPVGVQMLGSNPGTVRMVASGVIALDALVYTAASGKIQAAPTGATVFQVGRALKAATTDGHVIEVEPCFPLSVTFA